jgi:hypothetical protein
MTRYPAPELNDLPDDIKAKVLEVQEKAGFVPNVFLALPAARPNGAPSLPTTTR